MGGSQAWGKGSKTPAEGRRNACSRAGCQGKGEDQELESSADRKEVVGASGTGLREQRQSEPRGLGGWGRQKRRIRVVCERERMSRGGESFRVASLSEG